MFNKINFQIWKTMETSTFYTLKFLNSKVGCIAYQIKAINSAIIFCI